MASPAYFALTTAPLQTIRQISRPAESLRNDYEAFRAVLYIADGMVAESNIGDRPAGRIKLWGEIARSILGDDCINQEKLEEDAQWSIASAILGFGLNTDTFEIRAHAVKVQGAADFAWSAEFEAGRKPMSIKSLQTLRGLVAHWLNASMFWLVCLHPIDALLPLADDLGELANCTDHELTKAFWPMLQLLRRVDEDESRWHGLFRGDMRRLVEVYKRASGPATWANLVWVAGDATLSTVGCVNWNRGEYLKWPTEGIIREFNGPSTAPPIIADVELISSIAGVLAWAATDKSDGAARQIVAVGTDARNVFSWLRKGKARSGRPVGILVAFSARRIARYRNNPFQPPNIS